VVTRLWGLPAAEKEVHVHVYWKGSKEIGRYLLLHEQLREVERDRELYASTKRELASGEWPSVNHYAEAKTEVVEAILARAAE
jgi:GrpB-like predicted nucleotidyltransferase (UPF0157 family)